VLFKRKTATLAGQGGELTTEPAAVPTRKQKDQKEKLGWFEKRSRRRRRRILFEEALGWILVPAFIYLIYLGIRAVGGIPKELIDFGNELIGMVLKGKG